jgi:hypothetical protein
MIGIIVVFKDWVNIAVNRVVVVIAIKKVSVSTPEPNLAAINISLTNPSNLLPIPNIIIIKIDFAALLDCDNYIPPPYKI